MPGGNERSHELKQTAVSLIKYAHGTIIRTGKTCKKIPCYMRYSACRWFIVKKAKIF